ncbi:ATP-dependent DNA helicase RecG [Candidatus Uhrbacteria bacterium]|jgi:ATP-dependent DNA helicase RecG|nr:ATP-dependent DNA helicase RecG [Candidatus Uhrbacteria bacterium]
MINHPITALPGIGPKLSVNYRKLGIDTVRDLLLAFPFRYEDYRTIRGIADLSPGETTTVQGSITSIRSRRSPRKKMTLTEATIEDATGTITAVWFHQPYIAKTLKVGDKVSLSGKIDDKFGLSIVNPQFETIKDSGPTQHTGRLVPIYSVSGKMAQKGRRNAVKNAMKAVDEMEEWIPENVVADYDLASIASSIAALHFPEEQESWEKAMRRMKFAELLIHQIAHVRARQHIELSKAHAIEMDLPFVKETISKLPFALTDAQRKATFAIMQDMENATPMHRLLEGDVGSGKTVVAALAAGNTAFQGFQSAYLAPTEILAVQQASGLQETLGPEVQIALLTSSYQEINGESSTRKLILEALVDGRIAIVVGTHALLSDELAIPKLALVIVDEQHRFGVEQRKKLVAGRGDIVPHFLSMTATPIPRTLAMALYGDMNISILDELPPGRGEIETVLLRPSQDKEAYGIIGEKLKQGFQAYVVCPFIDVSEGSEADSVKELKMKLSKNHLRSFSIQELHGKMKAKEKDEIMTKFRNGEIDVLVSTTVIEVGVNVPNATTIFIEGAERFGLAQLHQLRGRVRRSSDRATCFLHPTSMSGSTKERLEAMVKHDSGFMLAEIDLKLRGSGDRFGTRQSGLPEFQFASLSDHTLISQARDVAEQILDTDPELEHNKKLADELERFLSRNSPE